MKSCKVDQYDCVEMTSGCFRIAITKEVGPRVIGGFIDGGPNIFAVLPPVPHENAGTGFCLRGGHRLWHSPEASPRSYMPDNVPPTITETEEGIIFDCEPEAGTGIKKTIVIRPGDADCFIVTHKLTNCGAWDTELAPWALSVMAPGGQAIIPQSRDTKRNPLAPDRSLVLWPYSHYDDERLVLGDDYIFLRQDSQAAKACKIGFYAAAGWIAYVNQGAAFVKGFESYDQNEVAYPDFGCNVESYSCKAFCEIETLAPLHVLAPGESCEHVEICQGIPKVDEIMCDHCVAKHLVPRIRV